MSFSSETVRYYPDLESTAVNTALGVFSTVTAFQDTDFKLATSHSTPNIHTYDVYMYVYAFVSTHLYHTLLVASSAWPHSMLGMNLLLSKS